MEKIKFDNARLDTNHLLHRIKNDVIISTNLSTGTMNSSIQEIKIVKSFRTTFHVPSACKIIQADCNTDSASRGSPDKDSFLGVFFSATWYN